MKTEIDAKTVKKLREETGAGMMNCKKALAEHNGNYEFLQVYFVNLLLHFQIYELLLLYSPKYLLIEPLEYPNLMQFA